MGPAGEGDGPWSPRVSGEHREIERDRQGPRRVKEAVMSGTPRTTGKCVPAWPKDALRIGFGVIWLIDAVLKWLPGFRSGYMSMLMGQAQGQPHWLMPWFNFWINLQHPRAIGFA